MKPLSVISLFTGAGGLDLGFEAAGFETRVAVENNVDAAATLRANRPHWTLIADDIHSSAANSKRILAAARLKKGDADILIGGPPCQPFSKSGYWRHGDVKRLQDPRSGTLAAFLRVMRETVPRTFLLENVPGLAFSRKDEGLLLLQRTVDSINKSKGTRYSFAAALVHAVEHGVPQDRQRVFVIGSRDGIDFTFPKASHVSPATDDTVSPTEMSLFGARTEHSQPAYFTSWDAIGDLEEDDDPALRVTGKWADLLPTIPEGKNYLHHTDRGAGLPLFGWRRRYWSFLLKLSKRLPSWTIAAQPGPAIGPFHWKNRRLSQKELMRLQTFPDNYRISGSLRSVQRQLGNAVPSALAERLALEIRRQLLGDAQISSAKLSLAPRRRPNMPPPEDVFPVPSKYLMLSGRHAPHPGTGLGYGASSRSD
jgi:DNA (cytosine-5)-methyltransferase 1